ncbi:MAG: NAD(+)/NADH kinase [Candidatus Omnitrophota bacterium]
MDIKRALLLYKISIYDYYTKSSLTGGVSDQEMSRFQITHDRHYRALEAVESACHSAGIPYHLQERGSLKDYARYDLIVTIGGDGTFLEGARYTENQLILGVNSDPHWSVGRFCTCTPDTFAESLTALTQDRHYVQELTRLQVETVKDPRTILFINDILVCHAHPAVLSRYEITLNGHTEEHRDSGIWISTAAGSTGAIRSAGGEVLDPEKSEFQYMPRELYPGWNEGEYSLTGGVLPADAELRLRSLMPEGVIYVDGAHERQAFPSGEEAVIRRSGSPLRVIRCGHS